jgi:sterol desaturase/sphingolipid hydroxylase (fatty acid hydroxylase superfamily)
MTTWTAAIFSACFVTAFILASLVEYWVHRLMHGSPQLKISERHREHHKEGTGQGVVWEFIDYVKGTIIAMCPLFLVLCPSAPA